MNNRYLEFMFDINDLPVGEDLKHLMALCEIDSIEDIRCIHTLPGMEEIWEPESLGSVSSYAEDNWSGRGAHPHWKDDKNQGFGYCAVLHIPDVGRCFYTQNASPVALLMSSAVYELAKRKFHL